jgi:hypothetical protein
MTSKIERVARAMCDDFLRVVFGEMGWDGNPPPNAEDMEREWREREWQEQKDMWMRAARAAIEAMREPTDAMVDAALSATGIYEDGSNDYLVHYQSMIDAALNEQVAG